MATETYAQRYRGFDAWSNAEILDCLLESQFSAVAAVRAALQELDQAVSAALPRLQQAGRLVYAGAGASGRLAIQDGAELFPTFGWPLDKTLYLMAGGEAALLHSIEQAEDSTEAAAAAISEHKITDQDVVLGVAASGRTPFTLGILYHSRQVGALTIGFANNPATPVLKQAEYGICLDTGAEALAGSTRMKAGTAQKIALNLFSTLLMTRLGRTYDGLMVDMQPTNAKLNVRSKQIIQTINQCSEQSAADALLQANGHIKLAVLIERGLDRTAAEDLLARSQGNLRAALASL